MRIIFGMIDLKRNLIVENGNLEEIYSVTEYSENLIRKNNNNNYELYIKL